MTTEYRNIYELFAQKQKTILKISTGLVPEYFAPYRMSTACMGKQTANLKLQALLFCKICPEVSNYILPTIVLGQNAFLFYCIYFLIEN